MIKLFVVIVAMIGISPCVAHENYYKENPKALQKVLQECSQNNPKGIDCDQLRVVANQISESVHELQIDPQGYGQRILALQELIAKQTSALQDGAAESELQTSLKENIQQLQERLAIVKWLESPES
jgi:flagellar motor component MotA